MANQATKNQRREQARLEAKQAREAQAKRDRTRRFAVQIGVVVAVVAIVAIVASLVMNSSKPGDNPRNMASGGVVFQKDLKVVETAAMPADGKRVPTPLNQGKKPVLVRVFVDFMCPACGNFEQKNGDMLQHYVESGDINLEIYPINFLDSASGGSKYSTRAANALACLADEQPDAAFKFHAALFKKDVQPEEGSSGLSDRQLMDQAIAAGAKETGDLTACIRDRKFGKFIEGNYKAVSEGDGVQGLAPGAHLLADSQTGKKQPDGKQLLHSTPLVIVDGEEWNGQRDGGLEAVIQKKLQNN